MIGLVGLIGLPSLTERESVLTVRVRSVRTCPIMVPPHLVAVPENGGQGDVPGRLALATEGDTQ
jgi:hypothetical protein